MVQLDIYSAANIDSQGEGAADSPAGQIDLPTVTDIPATISPQAIRDAVLQRYEHLQAIQIEYVQATQTFSWEEDVVPYGRYHFAFKGDMRLKAQSNAGISEPLFYPHVVWAWNGIHQQAYKPKHLEAYIKREFCTFAGRDLYLSTVGIPLEPVRPHAERQRSHSDRPWIQALSDASLDWLVLPQLEIVDGTPCHVLRSKNKEKLWIDPAIGFGIRFRETYRRTQFVRRKEWPLLSRCAYRDYRLTGGEIWLPWASEVVRYVTDDVFDTIYGQSASATNYRVQSLTVNAAVPDSVFTLEFPPGTIVRDSVNRKFYQLGDRGAEIKMGDWE